MKALVFGLLLLNLETAVSGAHSAAVKYESVFVGGVNFINPKRKLRLTSATKNVNPLNYGIRTKMKKPAFIYVCFFKPLVMPRDKPVSFFARCERWGAAKKFVFKFQSSPINDSGQSISRFETCHNLHRAGGGVAGIMKYGLYGQPHRRDFEPCALTSDVGSHLGLPNSPCLHKSLTNVVDTKNGYAKREDGKASTPSVQSAICRWASRSYSARWSERLVSIAFCTHFAIRAGLASLIQVRFIRSSVLCALSLATA
jgi:hypothetical protein